MAGWRADDLNGAKLEHWVKQQMGFRQTKWSHRDAIKLVGMPGFHI
jgi:hypothetical protein